MSFQIRFAALLIVTSIIQDEATLTGERSKRSRDGPLLSANAGRDWHLYPFMKMDPETTTCPRKIYGPCPRSRYRSIDGSCNNLRNPSWGTPNSEYSRIHPARYADGVHRPPISVTGSPLPGARLVSTTLLPTKPKVDLDHEWTLIAMQWGQLIVHDMSLAMGTTQTKPLPINCCPNGRLTTPDNNQTVNACFPIQILANDAFYSKFGVTCLNFVRTVTNVEMGCESTHGTTQQEQINSVTSWMDASFLYGSTPALAQSLRTGSGGRLRSEFRRGRHWPPPADNKTSTCTVESLDEPCYKFGDSRGNQSPQLTILQVLFLREHNRVAGILSKINPHWCDEHLYQEARRIVIAEYQHINYAEWLPIVLGTENMLKYGLLYDTSSCVNDYRDDVEPNVINEHATAAFRSLHSGIQGKLDLVSEARQFDEYLRLSDHFNKPEVIELGNNLDRLTRGMSTQRQQKIDRFYTREVADFLFRNTNNSAFGRDLRAIDIHRGRDHGLPSYISMLHVCGIHKAREFKDFEDTIPFQMVEQLSLVYRDPHDVDLYVGGSLEAHEEGTLAGPTFLCIMLEQFYRTRVSDRHFYQSCDSLIGFSQEQLKEITKSSVARLLCENSDSIQDMQPEAFRVIGKWNPLVSCSDTLAIPSIDFWHWRDRSSSSRCDYPVSYIDLMDG